MLEYRLKRISPRGLWEIEMNQDRLAGICKQLRGTLKRQWGSLSDNPHLENAGMREQLAGAIQERYGISKERTTRQLRDFLSRHGKLLNR